MTDEQTNNEQALKELEDSVKDVEVSQTFAVKSPAGDISVEFLDKQFSRIEQWLELKLANSPHKGRVIALLEFGYPLLRNLVLRALT